MITEERNKIINDAAETAIKLKNSIYDIVWESQEGQPEHFDTLSKAQKVALTGILNDALHLTQSLTVYQQWHPAKLNCRTQKFCWGVVSFSPICTSCLLKTEHIHPPKRGYPFTFHALYLHIDSIRGRSAMKGTAASRRLSVESKSRKVCSTQSRK